MRSGSDSENQRATMEQKPQLNANQTEPILRVTALSGQHVQRRALSRTKFTINAFENVDLSLFRGKTLALVGESGAGKSSLARSIALLDRPSAGKIELEGVDLLTLSRKALAPIRRRVQMIFQDATSALNPALTASELIAEPLAIAREGTRLERHDRALELMEQVGLDAKWERKRPFEFSGGQRQRLAIARALALEPGILVLDEAFANLDSLNQALILELLEELQVSRSLAYLHISHDLRLVSQFADQVAVMYQGRIVENKTMQDFYVSAEHFYTRDLLATIDSVESILLERSA